MDRRTFLLSVVLLPLVQFRPTQYGGTQHYNCEHAESAFGYWYVSGATHMIADWFFRDPVDFEVSRSEADFPKYGRIAGWFVPIGPQALQFVVWSMTTPGWWIEGSCVPIMIMDDENTPQEANEVPEEIQQLVDEGWGYTVEFNDGKAMTGFHFLPFDDMERMTEEERIRLGVEAHYQFALAHQPPPPTE